MKLKLLTQILSFEVLMEYCSLYSIELLNFPEFREFEVTELELLFKQENSSLLSSRLFS
jgi:hypothetical protein